MCRHRFEPAEDRMVPLPEGQYDAGTTFLMLSEGKLIFNGSLHELVTSEDPLVREFLE
jgi:phospholipid/cholesterol/gamma-HCH transport system ATP-binding protein